MLPEIHALVEAFRGRLGLDGRYPTPRDTDRLLEECFPGLVVETDSTPTPYVLMDDPQALIVLPRGLSTPERDLAILEELGHLLFDNDTGGAHRSLLGRLLLAQDGRCERAARLFVAAWRLPVKLVRHADAAEILEESGCSAEELAARQSMIGDAWR